jgi:hypothetical protein
MPKLVYIGGYGHSGSTLLEYLLTANSQILACGEVASVLRDGAKKKHCTCGRLALDCPVWGQFLTESGRSSGLGHAALALALLDSAGAHYDALVDSTKTAWRHALAPFRLRRKLGDDFLLVHLVRDPRAVAWSAIKKTERRQQKVNRPLFCSFIVAGWTVANLACEIFARRHPDQCLRLRYEDLAARPGESLDILLARIAPGAKWRGEELGAADNRHQLYGNRMRGKSLSLADVKEDLAWRADMPGAYRRLVSPLSAVLRARYGYA